MSCRPARAVVLLFVLLALAGSAATAGAASEEVLFGHAEAARKRLAADKEAQRYRHKWLNVIDRYERVLRKNPEGRLVRESLLAIADLYLGLYRRSRREADLDQALDHYRRLTKRFPQEPVAAEAQLRIGQLYYHYRQDPDRAYVEFLKVELNHPGSDQVTLAREWMAKISGVNLPKRPAPAQAAAPAGPEERPLAVVKGLRHWSTPTYTRIAVDVDDEVAFRDHLLRQDPALGKPMRLYLDLAGTRISPDIQEVVPIADGLLRRARVGQHDQGTVRVVLDIDSIQNYRIFSLKNPFRIVVDVTGTRAAVESEVQAEKPSAAEGQKEEASRPKVLADLTEAAQKRKKVPRGPVREGPAPSSLARQLGLGVRRVVLDPGHGGKDRGAGGLTGLREKDLTLKVARMLAARIRQRLGLEVLLTREGDEFVPLEERTAIANTKGADLFVSIHFNAHKDHHLHGLETYFLNLATDEEAMRVAARENSTSTKNMSDLQLILNDLMLNSKINESSRLAARVHRSMVGRLRQRYKDIRDLGVKQAPFYVLIGANMPSILVELGFLTNRAEEGRMKSSRYLDQLTEGLFQGIKTYTQSTKVGAAG